MIYVDALDWVLLGLLERYEVLSTFKAGEFPSGRIEAQFGMNLQFRSILLQNWTSLGVLNKKGNY